MERNHQATATINWVALLAATALSLALARYAGSTAGLAGVVFLGLGFLVAAVSRFQMRLRERERLEQIEVDELKQARGGAALFEGAAADSFPSRRSREQFERFIVPVFTLLLFAAQGGGAWLMWDLADRAPLPSADRAPVTLAFYSLFALVLFLLGKYSVGLTRLKGLSLLRPGAVYLMLGSVACFLIAASQAAAWFGYGVSDRILTRLFSAVLALVSAESLIALVLEIYRPRVRGQAVRVLYESRLIGLLGQPGGWITTAAQALDYQFGFKVSETWFYRFLERALSWIVLLQLGALLLSTAFVIIEPNEQALLERLGRPVSDREPLGPGFHVKWPWPIDQVHRFPTRQLRSFIVGVTPDPELEKERVVLWTRPHYKEEFNMLVASRERFSRAESSGASEKAVPANLLAASIPFHYEVTNLVQWTYGHSDAGRLLEHLANREVIRYLVSVDFEEVMSAGRQEAGEVLRERVQAEANRLQLGVRLVYVGLENIHPPIGDRQLPVAAAFEEVINSMQQAQTNILVARAYAALTLPGAEASATSTVVRAEGERISKVTTAAGEADQYRSRLLAYRATPSTYRTRAYLDTLKDAVRESRKYLLLSTNTSDVVVLNLEDKLRGSLAGSVILPPDARPDSGTNR